MTSDRVPVDLRVRWFESDTFNQLPRRYQALGRFMSLMPAMANMAQYHRYVF